MTELLAFGLLLVSGMCWIEIRHAKRKAERDRIMRRLFEQPPAA